MPDQVIEVDAETIVRAACEYADARRQIDRLPRQLLDDTSGMWDALIQSEERLLMCVSRMRSGRTRRRAHRPEPAHPGAPG